MEVYTNYLQSLFCPTHLMSLFSRGHFAAPTIEALTSLLDESVRIVAPPGARDVLEVNSLMDVT